MKNSTDAARLLAGVCALAAAALFGGEFSAGDCRASWNDTTLTLANARFTRVYRATVEGLKTISFKTAGGEELVRPAGGKATTFTAQAAKTRFSPVGEEGLAVTVSGAGWQNVYRVFPGAAGPLVTFGRTTDWASFGAAPADYREGLAFQRRKAACCRAAADELRLASRHVRVTAFDLMDRTDAYNELEQERETLLHALETPAFESCNVLDAVDVTTGAGIVFVRLAPLAKSRPVPMPDFLVSGSPYGITSLANGYDVAELAYTGGEGGRARALQDFQRALRRYRPGRDGIFLTNTWGDGNRDARINEEFLLKEVAAGAQLGVDVIQIDDGWQKGRTANSAAVKKGGGTWSTYWDVDPEFWKPCPIRFPRGLEPVVAAAKAQGLKFGLWFGPDSSHECAHWQDDANCLIDFHRRLGVDYFKMDSMVIRTGVSAERQRQMFDKMLVDSDGAMVFDLDCTANVRPGYFGLVDIGPLFVENRYIRKGDGRLYWPHFTLRNIWGLSRVVDPVRLRMEVLNPLRHPELYGDDALQPNRWPADALFAIAMAGSPLGWFEISNLAPETAAAMKPLVAAWKRERAAWHGGTIIPVGARPDGRVWTGFVSAAKDGSSGYALLFREQAENDEFELDLSPFFGRPAFRRAEVIGGRGQAELEKGGRRLEVEVPRRLDFIWVKFS